jgi:hypothetical protein
MKTMSDKQLQSRIDNFMAEKIEIFPELRHEPEMVIKDTTERRTISQFLQDSVTSVFSVFSSRVS